MPLVDVTDELRQRMHIVPLHVFFGDEEFVDGVTITSQEFYQRLVEGSILPTSSQPSPDSFERVYEQVTAAGDEAVVLTISSKLSGTYQSACIAAEDYPNIHVVDTLTATIASGVLAELALKLAEEGMSVTFISSEIEEMLRTCSRLIVMRDRKIVGELTGDDLTQAQVMKTIAGGE